MTNARQQSNDGNGDALIRVEINKVNKHRNISKHFIKKYFK